MKLESLSVFHAHLENTPLISIYRRVSIVRMEGFPVTTELDPARHVPLENMHLNRPLSA